MTNNDADDEPDVWSLGDGDVSPLLRLLANVWRDVNGQSWEQRSDHWAKVLRTFRSECGNHYSRRFAWFSMAIQSVLATSEMATSKDTELIKRIKEFDIEPLSRVAKTLQGGLSTQSIDTVARVDLPTWEDKRSEASEIDRELTALGKELGDIEARYRSAVERFRRASAAELWVGMYERDVTDAEWSHLACELRRHDFTPSEIAALVGELPREREGEPDISHKDAVEDAYKAMRSKINRDFERMGERKPPAGQGVRGNREIAYAPLSVRLCSSADDDADPNRTSPAGGS